MRGNELPKSPHHTPDGPKWTAQSGRSRGGCLDKNKGNVPVFSLRTAQNGRPGAVEGQEGCEGVNLRWGSFQCSRRP